MTTRIISWNCNMALGRKAPRLLALEPDIALVQECASSAELKGLPRLGWTGAHSNKGLAIFARASLLASIAEDRWDPTREWFLPIRVPSIGFNLLACRAMHHRGHEDRPKRGRIHATMEHYRDFLSSRSALVMGDLNDNVTWDRPIYPSFARLTDILADIGLANLYYERTGETPGAESQGSLYFYRHPDKPYLIDHAFLSSGMLERVSAFELGRPADWLDLSDHVPVILDPED